MSNYPMRRKDKEITNRAKIEELILQASVCHLGLSDDGNPYVVPMNYGYLDGQFYLHCATQGRKLDILRKNNRVCLEITVTSQIVPKEGICEWTTHYTSVIGFGRAHILETAEDKQEALHIFMQSYSGMNAQTCPPEYLRPLTMIRVEIDDIRGKQSPAPREISSPAENPSVS
jgi:nitroimidazol reductase NimA-like FMN-containing flavoprotein (pyridoxamine 5'-phosphate oxidase superfamily)